MDGDFTFLNEIETYCQEHSDPESPLLHEIAKYTWTTQAYPHMISSYLQGRLLSFISRIHKPGCILEIGPFTGYSTLCLAEGLQPEGVLVTIEKNLELEEKLNEFFSKSAYSKQINLLMGDALQIIPRLQLSPDLIFIDADKEEYPLYLEICLPMMKQGSLLIADNVLWGEKVVHDTSKLDKETKGIIQFNEEMAKKTELSVLMLPLRDGIILAIKK